MSKYLVLGGAGFIGSNLTRELVRRGERPRVFTRPTATIGNLGDILDQVDLVYGDFMDDVTLRAALKDVEIVFHLISTTFPSMTLKSSVYDILSNLLPTIRLAELCLELKVPTIVYASSGGTIYGEPQTDIITEHHPLVPKSAYGQSKLNIENYLRFYARTTSLDIKILRLSNPFGPRQNPYGIQGLIAVAMGCARDRRPLKIFGAGTAVRDYIYIDDAIEVMLRAATRAGPIVANVSSGRGTSVRDVVAAIEQVTGRTIAKQFVPERPGDVNVNILSNDLARGLYDWDPQVDLAEGLRRTWAWIQPN